MQDHVVTRIIEEVGEIAKVDFSTIVAQAAETRRGRPVYGYTRVALGAVRRTFCGAIAAAVAHDDGSSRVAKGVRFELAQGSVTPDEFKDILVRNMPAKYWLDRAEDAGHEIPQAVRDVLDNIY